MPDISIVNEGTEPQTVTVTVTKENESATTIVFNQTYTVSGFRDQAETKRIFAEPPEHDPETTYYATATLENGTSKRSEVTVAPANWGIGIRFYDDGAWNIGSEHFDFGTPIGPATPRDCNYS